MSTDIEPTKLQKIREYNAKQEQQLSKEKLAKLRQFNERMEAKPPRSLGLLGQTLLGATEGTPVGMVMNALNTLVKGASLNAFAEQQELDRELKQQYGIEMPELSMPKFKEQLSGIQKKSPTTPSGIMEAFGINTEPQNAAQSAARGIAAGTTAALSGVPTAASLAFGGAAGGAIPWLLKKSGMAPEATEAIEDAMSLMGGLYAARPIEPKATPQAEVLPKEIAPQLEPPAKKTIDITGVTPNEVPFQSNYHLGVELSKALEAAEPQSTLSTKYINQLKNVEALKASHERKLDAYEKRKARFEADQEKLALKEAAKQEASLYEQQRNNEIRQYNHELNHELPVQTPESDIRLGEQTRAAIEETSEKYRKEINKLYRHAEALQEEIYTDRKEFSDVLDRFINRWEETPLATKSQESSSALRAAKAIKHHIKQNEGLVSNKQLMTLEKELNNLSSYDFAPSDTPELNQLRKSITREIEGSSGEDALIAYEQAKNTYKQWAQLYNNKIISNWRDKSNIKFHKMINRAASEPDELLALSKVLPARAYETVLKKAIQKKVSPHMESGNAEGYLESLRLLQDVMPQKLLRTLQGSAPRAKPTVSHLPFVKPFAEPAPVAANIPTPKPTKIAPEKIAKQVYSISGIDSLEATLGKDNPILRRAKAHAAQQILTGGSIEQPITLESLRGNLHNYDTRTLLKRLLPPKEFIELNKILEQAEDLEKAYWQAEQAEKIHKEATKAEKEAQQKKRDTRKALRNTMLLVLSSLPIGGSTLAKAAKTIAKIVFAFKLLKNK